MEALHRKRTREHMHMHGMLPSAATVATDTDILQNVMTWFSDQVNAIRDMIARRPPPPQPQQPPPQAMNPAQANQAQLDRRKHMAAFHVYVNSFIPQTAGGQLEDYLFVQDGNGGAATFVTVADDLASQAVVPPQQDEPPLSDLTAPYDSRIVFRVMPMKLVLTGEMLLNLIRWPALLGASDNALMHTLVMLSVPSQRGKDKDAEQQILLDKYAGTAVAKDVEQTLRYHHIGAVVRACLSAFRCGLLSDRYSPLLDESSPEAICNYNSGAYMASGRGDDVENEYAQFDLHYNEWVQRLWEALDPACKVNGLHNATAEQLRASNTRIFFSYGQFESSIRKIVLPNNERSLSHLVLKTAFEGEYFDADGQPRVGSAKEALQRDSYYATMVRGSCVKIPLTPDIWCPHDELQHTGEETQHFFQVMWEGLDEVARQWHENVSRWSSRPAMSTRNRRRALQDAASTAGSAFGDDDDGDDASSYMNGVDIVTSTRRMRDIKRVMKEIWEESKSYRISDAVHMTEKQILARLHRDGLLPLYGDARLFSQRGMDPLHFCFLFRRHPLLRNQFASAVGKRMTSEKIIHTGKNSIMEHHRTVQWSENEYISMAQLVRAQASEVDKAIRSFRKDHVLFVDYVNMLTQNAQFDAANLAGYNLRVSV